MPPPQWRGPPTSTPAGQRPRMGPQPLVLIHPRACRGTLARLPRPTRDVRRAAIALCFDNIASRVHGRLDRNWFEKFFVVGLRSVQSGADGIMLEVVLRNINDCGDGFWLQVTGEPAIECSIR